MGRAKSFLGRVDAMTPGRGREQSHMKDADAICGEAIRREIVALSILHRRLYEVGRR